VRIVPRPGNLRSQWEFKAEAQSTPDALDGD